VDVEAIIEDLEAQAYFASLSGGSLSESATVIVQVNFEELLELSTYLRQPVLGSDFIAGFPAKVSKQWVIFPFAKVSSLMELTGTVQPTEVSMKDLIQRKLIGAKVILRPTPKASILSGVISGISGNLVQIRSLNQQVELFPLSSIHSLAVEKLSGE
jgi:hypothetical protein